MAGVEKLPYDILELVFKLAAGDDPCHGGEVCRWASHEESYSFALVCKAWTAPARRVLYSSVSIFTPSEATLFLRTISESPHLARHTRNLVVTLDEEEEEVEGEAPNAAEERHVRESEQLTQVVRACGSLERLQARTVHPRAAWSFLEAIVRQPRIKTFVGGPRPADYRKHSWHQTTFNKPVPLLYPTLLNLELSSPFAAGTRPSPILLFPKIETARLVCEIPEDTLCGFMKATSATLTWMDMYQERLLEIDFMADGLSHQFPCMRHLKYRVNPSITDLEASFKCEDTPLFDRLFAMEPSYQQLETLSVAATDISCEALRLLPPTLRHLEVSSFSDFSLFTFSDRLLEVLRDSSIDFRLEKLTIRDVEDGWGDERNMEIMEDACKARGIIFEFLAEDD